MNEGMNIDGKRIIRDNSALTREVIFSTVKNANEKLVVIQSAEVRLSGNPSGAT
jgi:hypothetical protein